MPREAGGGLVVPTAVSVVVTSGLGVAINLATDWKTNIWAWAILVMITLLAAATTLWLTRRKAGPAGSLPGGPVVRNARIGRDNIQLGQISGDVTIERDR